MNQPEKNPLDELVITPAQAASIPPMKKQAKRKKGVYIPRLELQALLFWASFGVSRCSGGSHPRITKVIPFYAKKIKFQLSHKPEFKGTPNKRSEKK